MKNPRVVKMPWIICVIYLCTNILDASILIRLRDPSCKKKIRYVVPSGEKPAKKIVYVFQFNCL